MKSGMKTIGVAGIIIAAAMAAAQAAEKINVDFSRGAWNPADFTPVKSWRWNYLGVFEQLDDAIVNKCPNLPAEEILKKHGNDVYAALLHKETFGLGTTVESTTMFDYRMAPIVVIAPELGAAADGTPEFREHWEACLFDKGVNLWHHFFVDGKQEYRLAASMRMPEDALFKPDVKHRLSAKVWKNRYGRKCITVSCDGFEFTHDDDALPETFRAGVIGCEGRNFFYDFKVSPGK